MKPSRFRGRSRDWGGVVPQPKVPPFMSLTVQDIMSTEVRAVNANTPLTQVAKQITGSGTRQVVVIDDTGTPVGLFSDRDLLSYLARRTRSVQTSSGTCPVRDVIRQAPPTVTPDTPLGVASGIMADKHVSCLPVVDSQHKLVGILTSTDLLGWLADHPVLTMVDHRVSR